jgi:hypothetical protein
MVINHLKSGLLITATLIITAFSCNKDKATNPCVVNAYSFAVTSEWIQQREVYSIGDTIFLNSTFQKNLLDLVGNYNVDYSNAKSIGGNVTFYELDSVQHRVLGAVSKFVFSQITGSNESNSQLPNEIKNIFYHESSSAYTYKIGVIPKSKGLFAFFISNLNSQGILGKNCTNASFVNALSNTNKNINLFQYAMNRPPASQFEIDRIYCFRVQ